MMPKPVSVNPHGSPVIHPVKHNVNPLEFPHCRWQYKILVIHSLPAGKIPRRASHLRVKWQFDAPVMRHVNRTKLAVTCSSLSCSLCHFACRHLSLFRFGVVCHLCFLRFPSGFPEPYVLPQES